MLERVTRELIDQAPALLGGDASSRVRYLGLPGSPEGRTTTFLGFAGGRSQPSFVVKIFREPQDRARASNEVAVLRRLADTPLALSVPRVLAAIELSGLSAIVESFVAGRPMQAKMIGEHPEPQDADRNLVAVFAWLARLHVVSADPDPLAEATNGAILALRSCADTFELDPAERAYIGSIIDTVRAARLGSTVCHGDFTRHNILATKDRIGVVDWSDARMRSLPLHDAFAFVTSYFLQLRPQDGLAGFLAAFDATFLAPSAFSSLIARHVRDQCRLTGVDPANIEPLLAIFLAERAMFEYDQIKRSMSYGSLPRATLAFAAELGADADRSRTAQYWIHFLRRLIARRADLVLTR